MSLSACSIRVGLLSPFAALIFILTFCRFNSFSQDNPDLIPVDVKSNLERLLHEEDTDSDLRITIIDSLVVGTNRGDGKFLLRSTGKSVRKISGVYQLSNLLQELKLADDAGKRTVTLDLHRVEENPVDYISRNIRERFWDGLTRSVDEKGLTTILSDEKSKSADGYAYLYVPHDDDQSKTYFEEIAQRRHDLLLRVTVLPADISPEYVKNLEGKHGILALALQKDRAGKLEGVPFVVPGGRFNEMYGWDSYFILLGLLQDGLIDRAKDLVENVIYEIDHYGAILNANRTYYLTRSQPPFLTSMVSECYKRLPRSLQSKHWLRTALRAAIKEYNNVWCKTPRLTSTGLSRYYDLGSGVPPEVESGHFDNAFRKLAARIGLSADDVEQRYRSGSLRSAEIDAYFVHDRCMRESGHDTSYRLEGCCADLVSVDLNSLLFKYEMDIAELIRREFDDTLALANGSSETSAHWFQRAGERKRRMNALLWSSGMFFDYDYVQEKPREYVSATTFYPLWAGFASEEQAASLVRLALPQLEAAGGVAASAERSRGPLSSGRQQRQWDYPFGWAPHQILIWRGLMNYGYDSIAQRLVYKWLYTVMRNAADYNGTVTEKYDVVKRSHQVFAEYGNVGTTFSYITREGFGWTNASVQIGRALLTTALKNKLRKLVRPEAIFNKP